MNTIRELSNSDLLSITERIAGDERKTTLEILDHLREVERRKAYSELGLKSLFEYAVSRLRYSEGSASRRIAAVYAIRENPELKEKIEKGETHVTAVARIHTTIRRDEKLSAQKWKPERRKQIFQEMASLPMRELERNLFEYLPKASVQERVRAVTETLHEVKVYLTSDELQALSDLRGWYGHALKDPTSNSELFRKLIQVGREEFIRMKSGVKRGEVIIPSRSENDEHSKEESGRRNASPSVGEINSPFKEETHTSTPLKTGPSSRDQRTVMNRAGLSCEFTDKSGKRCGSRHLLQIDHVKPRGIGGTDATTNLQVLCRAHNLIRGIRTYGPEKMRRD